MFSSGQGSKKNRRQGYTRMSKRSGLYNNHVQTAWYGRLVTRMPVFLYRVFIFLGFLKNAY